jgi:hypothetical protein
MEGSSARDGGDGGGGGDGGVVQADFFVSPAGTDAPSCGKIASPCKTIAYTQPLVQALVKTNPGRTVSVVLRGNAGPFWLTKPLSFGTEDSGTTATPVSWNAYPAESPVISGGVPVTGHWTSASQAGGVVWTTPLPSSIVDFGGLFIDGKRHYTPRSTSGYLNNVGPVCLSMTDPKFSASACKTADKASSSKCTNTSAPYECYDRFVYDANDISASWKNITVGSTHPIVIDDFEDWTVSKLRLSSVDATNHIAYLTGPTEEENEFHGFLAGHRYVVENVEDFLTAASGNFYVDESTGPWTLSYFTSSGDDPNTETIVMPQLASLLATSSPLEYVTFQGLTFSHDNWTVPAVGYPSSQAEPLVTAAVTFVDSSHVTVDACIFTNIQGHALELKGSGAMTGTGGNLVTNSAFYDLGGSGMLIGLPWTPHYGDADETGNNTVSNNIVTGGGRVVPGAELLFIGDSDNNIIEHNEISDGYGDGISACVPDGATACPTYGNQIRYNHVHNIKQGVTSDGGGIYLFSYNTAHTSTPNVISYNWVHDVTGAPPPLGYGSEGIYLDNDSVNVTVESNLVYRASEQSMFVNYGQGHTITNNIFAFGREGIIGRGYDVVTTGALSVPAFTASKNIFLWDQNTTIPTHLGTADAFVQSEDTWDCFNEACTTQFQFASNIYWTPTTGIVPMFIIAADTTPAAVPFTGTGSWQSKGEDTGSVFADPHFTNPSCGVDDYSFSSLDTVKSIGFVPFDYTSAGRTAPVIIPPKLDAAFPLQTPSDLCSFY